MAKPEPRRGRVSLHVPLDEAVLLVSIPSWGRDNAYTEYPDRLPDSFANLMLAQRYHDRLAGRL